MNRRALVLGSIAGALGAVRPASSQDLDINVGLGLSQSEFNAIWGSGNSNHRSGGYGSSYAVADTGVHMDVYYSRNGVTKWIRIEDIRLSFEDAWTISDLFSTRDSVEVGASDWSGYINTQYHSPWLLKAFGSQASNIWKKPDDGNPGDFTIRMKPRRDSSSGSEYIYEMEWYVTRMNNPSFIGV